MLKIRKIYRIKNIRCITKILLFLLLLAGTPVSSWPICPNAEQKGGEIERMPATASNRPSNAITSLFWFVSALLAASVIAMLKLASARKMHLDEIQQLKLELKQAKKTHQRDIEAYKDRELSVRIIEQEMRNSLIEKLMIKLQRLRENFQERQHTGFNTTLADLDKMLDNNLWFEFERSFAEIHPRFAKKLRAQYPDLSSIEIKVCTLIRINLTSKEISKLTDLSVKSIEATRTKLRKRFGLIDNNLMLSDFLCEFN